MTQSINRLPLTSASAPVRTASSGSPAAIWLVVMLALCGIYLWQVFQFTPNAPRDDDLAIFVRLGTFKHWSGWASLGDLLKHHNEHRLGVMSLIAYAQYTLSGVVNFKLLALMGNLSLLLAFAVLAWGVTDRKSEHFWPVCLLGLLVFVQWRYWQASVWPMVTISGFPAILFAVTTMVLLARSERWAFGLAIGSAALATLSQGNGLFIWPAGMLMLAVQQRWRAMAVWTTLTALVIPVYFIGYVAPPSHVPISTALRNPHLLAGYFLVFLGNYPMPGFVGPWRLWLAGLLGGGLLSLSIWTILRHGRQNPALAGMLLFCLISGAAAAMGRATLGLDQALSSRYAIIPSCMWASLLLWAGSRRWPGLSASYGVVLAVLAASWIWSYQQAAPIIEARRLEAELGRVCDDGCVEHLIYPNLAEAFPVVHDAEKDGLFHFPRSKGCLACSVVPLVNSHVVPANAKPYHLVSAKDGWVDRVERQGAALQIVGWARHALAQARVLEMALPAAPSQIKILPVAREDVATMLGDPRHANSGFRLTLQFSDEVSAQAAEKKFCIASRTDSGLALLNGQPAICDPLFLK